jgi:hypothetical protein
MALTASIACTSYLPRLPSLSTSLQVTGTRYGSQLMTSMATSTMTHTRALCWQQVGHVFS